MFVSKVVGSEDTQFRGLTVTVNIANAGQFVDAITTLVPFFTESNLKRFPNAVVWSKTVDLDVRWPPIPSKSLVFQQAKKWERSRSKRCFLRNVRTLPSFESNNATTFVSELCVRRSMVGWPSSSFIAETLRKSTAAVPARSDSDAGPKPVLENMSNSGVDETTRLKGRGVGAARLR